MLKQCITILVNTAVGGPAGKLKAGKVYELDDTPYVRLLIKSGTVELVDPPSLDPEFLEEAGYELKEGHSYPEKKVVEEEPEKIGRMKIKRQNEPVPGPYLVDGPKPIDPTGPKEQVYYGVHSSPERDSGEKEAAEEKSAD